MLTKRGSGPQICTKYGLMICLIVKRCPLLNHELCHVRRQARYQAIQAAYTTLLPAIKTALDNLDGSLGSTGSSSDTTGVNKATLTTDLNAIDISGWDIQLNTLDLALLNGVGTNNPFTGWCCFCHQTAQRSLGTCCHVA